MIVSFHCADLALRDVGTAIAAAPKPTGVSGLRTSNVAFAAPLSPSPIPKPSLRRLTVVSLWDDDAALDRHLVEDPLPELMAQGWRVRLEPLRLTGSWPGLQEPSAGAEKGHEGPTVVLTLGRLRVRRAIEFFRASADAERQILAAPGLIWATGMGFPPFVGTCSLWQNQRSLTDFAYRQPSPHGDAMAADRKDPFHNVSAFVRLRPFGSVGGLTGTNPLDSAWLDPRPVALTAQGPRPIPPAGGRNDSRCE